MANILVIDDDPDILDVVKGALVIEGHRVLTSDAPANAVDLAVDHAADLIVLDVNMPEVSGFDALDAVRADPRTASTSVLFLSALSDSRHKVKGLRSGADDYLGKPFVIEELVLRVDRALARQERPSVDDARTRLVEAIASGDFRGEVYLGRYRALERIGAGAMGVVLRGWDPRLKRPVALKTLKVERLAPDQSAGDSADSEKSVRELVREASTMARFHHPNIVTVHDVGAEGHIAYLVMEYIDGHSLQSAIRRRGVLSGLAAVRVGLAAVGALRVASAKDVVHRDIKPGNVLLGRQGTIKLTDFGLASLASQLGSKSSTVFGTPGFLPPECLKGEPHTAAGDRFGLGSTLYRMLTGRSPFGTGTLHQVLSRTLTGRPTPVIDVNTSVPGALSLLVSSLLVTDPEARPTLDQLEEQLLVLEQRLADEREQADEELTTLPSEDTEGSELLTEPRTECSQFVDTTAWSLGLPAGADPTSC